MLSVYTRHSQKCPHRDDDIAWRRCRCPKWIQGSAQTRTWEHLFLKEMNGIRISDLMALI